MTAAATALAVALLVCGVGLRAARAQAGAPAVAPGVSRDGDATASRAVSVVTTQVVARSLTRVTDLQGELAAFQDVAVFPRVQGFVQRIDVDRGSRVRAGQVLAVLDAPELAIRRGEAECRWQSARAQALESEATHAAQDSTFRRLETASSTPGVVAANDLQIARETAKASSLRVQRWWDSERAARRAVDECRQMEAYLSVTAPFDGVITERNVHVGSLVGPAAGPGAAPMLRLQDVARLRLTVPVPEGHVASIVEGLGVPFTVPAFPAATFAGTVRRVAHALDARTRTEPCELDVDNADGRLAPGMYAQVRWPVRRPDPSLVVPISCVATTTERAFVVRVRSGKIEWVDVRRGITAGDQVEVFGELAAGDRVAVRGTDELRPGSVVSTVGGDR